MTFCAGASASAEAAGSATAPSVGARVCAGASFCGGAAVGPSNEARMREIGGKTVVFYFLLRNLRLGWGKLMRGNWFAGCSFFGRCFRFCCHFKKLLRAQAP